MEESSYDLYQIAEKWDRLGIRNVARQIRYFDAHVDQAIQLLLTGQCSVF